MSAPRSHSSRQGPTESPRTQALARHLAAHVRWAPIFTRPLGHSTRPAALLTRIAIRVCASACILSRLGMSRPPYPPPSALDGGGLGGRSTIDCLIGMARQCVDRRCATSCTRALHTCHAPDPRVPSLALSRSQLKTASCASRRRTRSLQRKPPLLGSLKHKPLAQAAAPRSSRRCRSLKPPPRLAQAAAVRLAQAAAPPLAQAAALLGSSRRRSHKPPPLAQAAARLPQAAAPRSSRRRVSHKPPLRLTQATAVRLAQAAAPPLAQAAALLAQAPAARTSRRHSHKPPPPLR